MKTINFNGELLDFNQPKVAGIVNLTTDSFYDGGKYYKEKEALQLVERLLVEGADIIDIGGQSTRPGSKFLSAEEELNKVIPFIESIVKEFPKTRISVDTFWSKVAKESVNAGAGMINDISGGEIDPEMFQTVGELQVPYILMHIKGTPQTMTKHTNYADLVLDINYYFSEKLKALNSYGVNDVLIDPGFGFSKTLEQNYELIKNLDKLKIFSLPIYTGISRKGMIYKLLKTTPEEALAGTSALHLYSLQKGANILRVHDVKEAKQIINLWEMLK